MVTLILCVVAPLLHKYDAAEVDVSVTDPPGQKLVPPFAVITGTGGRELRVTVVEAEVAEQPAAFVTVTE